MVLGPSLFLSTCFLSWQYSSSHPFSLVSEGFEDGISWNYGQLKDMQTWNGDAEGEQLSTGVLLWWLWEESEGNELTICNGGDICTKPQVDEEELILQWKWRQEKFD
jgi:hypothetical protein